MSHVRTSPYYPQSNGKIKRWHKTIKQECIRKTVLLSKEDANRTIEKFIENYNHQRRHSSIGYVTPADRIKGKQNEFHSQRDYKLKQAREKRAFNRKQQNENLLQVQTEKPIQFLNKRD